VKNLKKKLQDWRWDLIKLQKPYGINHFFQAQQKEITDLAVQLESERYRAERLEEQINDLTELHQNEIENLKQNIADMEEKVQYQSDERLRDVNDVLENCQTRVSTYTAKCTQKLQRNFNFRLDF
jgi:chromosome segregation ATPase